MNTPEIADDGVRRRGALVFTGILAKGQGRIQASAKYKWLVVVVVCMTAFMSTLEQGMLNVALPMMTTELPS